MGVPFYNIKGEIIKGTDTEWYKQIDSKYMKFSTSNLFFYKFNEQKISQ